MVALLLPALPLGVLPLLVRLQEWERGRLRRRQGGRRLGRRAGLQAVRSCAAPGRARAHGVGRGRAVGAPAPTKALFGFKKLCEIGGFSGD